METDPLEIHHVIVKNEVYGDYTDSIEIEPIPVIIKSEVFEDDSNSVEVEPAHVIITNEKSEDCSDGCEVKPTPFTDDLNVTRNDIDISGPSTPSSGNGMHFVSKTDWVLNQCCRICAQKSSGLISVFGEEGLFRQLVLKMRRCLQVIVQESDDLPTAVCWKCVSKLEVCFELMQEYVRGQNVLERRMISQQKPYNWKQTEVRMEYSHPGQLTAMEQEKHISDTHESPNLSYGGLPLLAEVTDKNRDISDASCSGPSHVISDRGKNIYPEANTESQNKAKKRKTRIRKLKVSCEFCGKVFNHTGDLNKHRRRHTGEHPYPCPQCHKRFSHASNLIRHQKIHSGETLHQCATCARTFSRKDNIVKHIENSRCKPNPLAYLSA